MLVQLQLIQIKLVGLCHWQSLLDWLNFQIFFHFNNKNHSFDQNNTIYKILFLLLISLINKISKTSLSLTFGGPGTATITYAFSTQGSTPCSLSETTTIQVNDVLPQLTLNIPSKINTGQSFKANGTVSEVGFWTRPSVVLSINGVLSTAICSVTAQSTLSINTQYSFTCGSVQMSSAGSYTIRAIANVSWGSQNLLSNYSQKTLTVGNTFWLLFQSSSLSIK